VVPQILSVELSAIGQSVKKVTNDHRDLSSNSIELLGLLKV
jgi:hypothetical protein